MASSASVELFQGGRARIERSIEDALRRKEAFQACIRDTEAPRLSSLPSLSCQPQPTRPLSADTVMTFQGKVIALHPMCENYGTS